MQQAKRKLSRSVKRGMILLLGFSVAGIAALVAAAGGADSLAALGRISPASMCLVLIPVVVNLLLGGLRNHIFIRRIKPGAPFLLSLKADMANIFLGAITPSQGLGGPAQLAVLRMGGIPLGAAISVSVLNFTGTVLFFGAGVVTALVFFRNLIVSETIVSTLWACAALFVLALLMLVLAVFKPSFIKLLFVQSGRLLTGLFQHHRDTIANWTKVLCRKVDEYHDWCLEFIRKKPLVVILSIILTAVIYLNKFVISWLVARGLGLDVSLGAMFSSLYLITFICYFAPSPGAGGIAEVATGILLAPLILPGYLPVFTLLSRLFTLFIPAALGFASIVGMLKVNPEFLQSVFQTEKKGEESDLPRSRSK